MIRNPSPGEQLRNALEAERPLQIVGVINAYAALMAQQIGFKALYLSGAGIANACFGLPDVGITNLSEVTEEVRRITQSNPLPLIVDADTGWGNEVAIRRTVQQISHAGAAGLHLEDQISEKRCGHLIGKTLIPAAEMAARIEVAVAAKPDPNFMIIARTDAYGSEGIASVIERLKLYVAAGANAVFPEALTQLSEYQQIAQQISVPVLANLTEFGKTPLFSCSEMASVGVAMLLYPLSAWRAMNAAALEVYRTIREQGTQKSLINRMQTREALYRYLHYQP